MTSALSIAALFSFNQKATSRHRALNISGLPTSLISITDTIPDSSVVLNPEIQAAFPGGDAAWRSYLEKAIRYFDPADYGAPKGRYKVLIQFTVDTLGNVSNLKRLTNHGYQMEEKVIEMITKGPRWIPAIKNGKNVNAYRLQPVTFEVNLH